MRSFKGKQFSILKVNYLNGWRIVMGFWSAFIFDLLSFVLLEKRFLIAIGKFAPHLIDDIINLPKFQLLISSFDFVPHLTRKSFEGRKRFLWFFRWFQGVGSTLKKKMSVIYIMYMLYYYGIELRMFMGRHYERFLVACIFLEFLKSN